MKPAAFLRTAIPGLFLLAVVEMAFTPAAWADKGLKLTFQEHVETVRQAKKGKNPKETKSDGDLTVTLWPSVFSVDDGKKTTFYDFDRRKIDVLDRAKKTYEEDSLYFEIGYRTAEFRNRLFLQNALKAGGEMTPEFQTFQLEILFGLRHPKEKTPDAVARRTGPGTWNFNAPTKELVTQAKLSGTPHPGGPPKVLGALPALWVLASSLGTGFPGEARQIAQKPRISKAQRGGSQPRHFNPAKAGGSGRTGHLLGEKLPAHGGIGPGTLGGGPKIPGAHAARRGSVPESHAGFRGQGLEGRPQLRRSPGLFGIPPPNGGEDG